MGKTDQNRDRTGMEIAVIGMAGRFPGARNIDEYWNNLKKGVESISFFSEQELEEAGTSLERIQSPGFVKAKGVLDDIEYFDASFFEYTAKEAEIMDPQLRILHECCWEALENAGYNSWFYHGLIGFYAGASHNFLWLARFLSGQDVNNLTENELFEIGTLNTNSSFCTRLSYKLNLKGPSVFIQTACSTSLVAIHLACQGLLAGESSIALAGGVSISIPKKSGYLYQEGMLFSTNGHIRTFDANADGTIFGSGVGIVVLKSLEDALADGDTIHAVIKGSAINNDGSQRVGFTAPGTKGQAAVIRAALRAAEVEPESISYIEAHGTGTTLGDPIEIQALKLAFKTPKTGFCKIGSVKTNFGHLDAAAGVAGFIKIVLALKHKKIPATLNFEIPNPEIDFENSPFIINTSLTEWRNDQYPLRAGVSAFGIGGTNAHIILEEAPEPEYFPESKEWKLLLFSARSESALEQITRNFVEYLRINPGINLSDAAFTLQVGRKVFQHRRMLVCRNLDDAIEAFSIGSSRKIKTNFSRADSKALIFMFPGVGSQYLNMGRDLYLSEPLFREEMDRCFEILKSLIQYNIKEFLYPRDLSSLGKEPSAVSPSLEEGRINQPEIAQLIIFIFEYALAKLLIQWGIKPKAMIGYSLGEYTAACLSGVLSLEDALDLVRYRSQLVKRLTPGLMLSVPVPKEELGHLLTEFGDTHHDRLSLAIDNGPSCVVAGPVGVIDAFAEFMKYKKCLCMRINNSHAMHSYMMEPILEEFERKIRQLSLNKPQIPYISNLTGDWLSDEQAVDPRYWARHMGETVRFADGIKELVKEPEAIFIEVGPGRDLSTLIPRYMNKNSNQQSLNLTRQNQKDTSDVYVLLNRIGQLWLQGVCIDWKKFYTGESRCHIPLPTYPFESRRFWPEKNFIPRLKPSKDSVETGLIDSAREESSVRLYKKSDLYTEYIPPSNEIEKKLVNIWEQFFGVDNIGIDDDFFEMGGDSLKASIVISRMHKAFQIEILLADFFKRPTIKSLALFITENLGKSIHSAIELKEKKEYYSLSSAQKRIYILNAINDKGIGYNLPSIMILKGNLSITNLKDTFKRLIVRHESLRTSFTTIQDEPIQKVHEEDVEFEIEYFDLENSAKAVVNREELLPNTDYPNSVPIIKNFIRAFDLSQVPLFRVGLLKEKEDTHILVVDMHHIVSDGMSMGIMIKEALLLYRGEALAEIRLQYKDFSAWQNSKGMRELIKQEEEYWLKEFVEEVPKLNLPTDFSRPQIQNFEGGRRDFVINADTTRALKRYALNAGTTLFIVLLSVYNIFLSKISGQEDVVVGIPEGGRNHSDLENIVGMLVKTLPLRNFPKGEKGFKQFLSTVKSRMLEAFANRNYPYEDLVEKISVDRDASRNPLFDTMFLLLNYEIPEIRIPGLTCEYYRYDQGVSRFDLTLRCIEHGDVLECRFDYCSKLFKPISIERFESYFKAIISRVVDNPIEKISNIEIISEKERNEILYDFNDTYGDYPADKTIHQLFAEQAAKTPGGIAVVGPQAIGRCTERCTESLTFGELDTRSQQLAAVLRSKGIADSYIVSIMSYPSTGMMVAILGVLKSGGCYLPLAPQTPDERINYILKDSETGLVLTHPELSCKVKAEVEIMNIECLDQYQTNFQLPPKTSAPEFPVYMIFTSGTTGKPKGVLIKHENLVNYTTWFSRVACLSSEDNTILTSSFAFDLGYTSIYPSLLAGGRLHLLPKESYMVPGNLLNYINRCGITYIKITPSFFAAILTDANFADKTCGRLRLVVLGGESIDTAAVENFHRVCSHIKVMNHYGPTETTIGSIAEFIDFDQFDTYKINPTIGKPILNTQVFILDKYLHLLPVGIAGELYISGAGVSKGYKKQESLNTEKFIKIPFYKDIIPANDRTEQIFYRTGDLARWRPNGKIQFLGRIDNQYKIRGYRIELGEIENQLLKHEAIKEAVVVVKSDAKDSNYLCAYITAHTELARDELIEFLSRSLPEYMIPIYFVSLQSLPLTPNGKVDRNALPDNKVSPGEEYIAPQTTVEEQLIEIWSDVLGIEKEKIGTNANFFAIGGHSLKAVVMLSRVHKILNINIPLAELFRIPSIKGLSQYIKRAEGDRYIAIEPVEKKECYVLSSAQKRLYILQQLELDSIAYNMPGINPLIEAPDLLRLEATFIKLIHRHESLRTSFLMAADEPVQRIHDDVEFVIERLAPEAFSYGSVIRNFIRPFDLSRAPLLRVGLIKTREKYVLLIDMHHIISDGVSHRILIEDFIKLYRGEELNPLMLQYKDYSKWQNKFLVSKAIKKQEKYWLELLAGDIPVLSIPHDFTRPVIQSFAGDSINFSISDQNTLRLKEMALEENITLYMLLFSIFNILLSRLSSQEDIIVGTPIAGRRHADLEPIIGMFVNTLVLRSYPIGEKPFRQFLSEVKAQTLEAFENQDYQFEELVEQVELKRDASRNPIFDVMFSLVSEKEITYPGLQAKGFQPCEAEADNFPLNLDSDQYSQRNKIITAKFDLTLVIYDEGHGLSCSLQYCTRLFKKDTIQQFAAYFSKLTAAVLEGGKDKKIKALEMMSPEQLEQLLFDFNNTKMDYPRDKTLHELFENQGVQIPDSIAINHFGGKRFGMSISYFELMKKCDYLAHRLRSKGVTLDSIVAILTERSIEMVIGLLGILKAGGAYLPIEPDYPEDRINYMLADSNAKILVTTPELIMETQKIRNRGVEKGLDIVFSNPAISSDLSVSSLPRAPLSGPSNLAYIIFTSGTTGRPKGVMVEHKNILRLVKNPDYIRFSLWDRLLLTGAVAFDISTFEIWAPLLNEITLYLPHKDIILHTEQLAEVLAQHDISILHLIPQLFNQIAARNLGGFARLKYFLIGGDLVQPMFINKLRGRFPNLKILHMYGPTENTTFSTSFLVDRDYENSIPIGKPIRNSFVYILDQYFHMQPKGVMGELCVGGDGLVRGYLNKPELSKEKFIQPHICANFHNFTKKPRPTHSSLYRTGDMGRWLTDGNIEFLGRRDHQVKIRGFRIELGEIENQLLKYQGIEEVVVIDREAGEDKYLCAYIAADAAADISIEPLRLFLRQFFPDYMIPAYYIPIEKIPLTPNGKINYKALPPPEINTGDDYSPPRDVVEEKMALLWSQVLGIKQNSISINHNFFDLGGQSLKATTLISKIHQSFDARVTLSEFFNRPTIRELAQNIRKGEKSSFFSIEPVEKKEYYPLSSSQRRLYILQGMTPETTAYNVPAILTLEGELDALRFEEVFRQLIDRHETFRTSFEIVNRELIQRIYEAFELSFQIEYFDIAAENVKKSDKEPAAPIIENFIHPFDLSQAPLLRVGLIKLEDQKHVFMVDMHHIISDGSSGAILINDFMTLYKGEGLTPLKLEYKDISVWQDRVMLSVVLKKQEEYWLERFNGEIPVVDMPTDYPRPPIQHFEGADLVFVINEILTRKIQATATKIGATLYMVLLAICSILLAKYSGQDDIIIGTPIAGRSHLDMNHIVGMFVNVLLMRNKVNPTQSFTEFLQAVKENALQAFENQDYQFDKLVEQLEVKRDRRRNLLYDTVFVMENYEKAHLEIPGLKLFSHRDRLETAKTDLRFGAVEMEETVQIRLTYSISIFTPSTAEEIAQDYLHILKQVVEDNCIPLKDITITHDMVLLKPGSLREQAIDFTF